MSTQLQALEQARLEHETPHTCAGVMVKCYYRLMGPDGHSHAHWVHQEDIVIEEGGRCVCKKHFAQHFKRKAPASQYNAAHKRTPPSTIEVGTSVVGVAADKALLPYPPVPSEWKPVEPESSTQVQADSPAR